MALNSITKVGKVLFITDFVFGTILVTTNYANYVLKILQILIIHWFWYSTTSALPLDRWLPAFYMSAAYIALSHTKGKTNDLFMSMGNIRALFSSKNWLLCE